MTLKKLILQKKLAKSNHVQPKHPHGSDPSAYMTKYLKQAMDDTAFTQYQLLLQAQKCASEENEDNLRHVRLMGSSSHSRKRLLESCAASFPLEVAVDGPRSDREPYCPDECKSSSYSGSTASSTPEPSDNEMGPLSLLAEACLSVPKQETTKHADAMSSQGQPSRQSIGLPYASFQNITADPQKDLQEVLPGAFESTQGNESLSSSLALNSELEKLFLSATGTPLPNPNITILEQLTLMRGLVNAMESTVISGYQPAEIKPKNHPPFQSVTQMVIDSFQRRHPMPGHHPQSQHLPRPCSNPIGPNIINQTSFSKLKKAMKKSDRSQNELRKLDKASFTMNNSRRSRMKLLANCKPARKCSKQADSAQKGDVLSRLESGALKVQTL